ncbi:hypothetical protein GCM10027168_22400 [Streptomyces capparidis]
MPPLSRTGPYRAAPCAGPVAGPATGRARPVANAVGPWSAPRSPVERHLAVRVGVLVVPHPPGAGGAGWGNPAGARAPACGRPTRPARFLTDRLRPG